MNKDNYVIKQASVNIDDISEKGILSGYANVYNIEDTDGDISQVGSFTKTVTENRKRIKILKNHAKKLLRITIIVFCPLFFFVCQFYLH